MSVLDRKLRRDLFSAWFRLAAITCIIAVGVACYVEFSSCYSNLNRAKDRYYAQCRMADFTIDLKKVPTTNLAVIADLPGVIEIRPRIQFFATVDLTDHPRLLNGQVLSLPDRQKPIINDIVLRSGSYFTEERANEVIVNDAFARHHGIRPGDWIHLILNNRRQELFVVGTAISSEYVYLVGPGALAPDPEHFGVFYLKQTYAEDVYDFQGAANQVLGLLVDGVRERPDDLLRRAEQMLEPFGVFSSTPLRDQASNRYLTGEMDGLATFTTIMPAMFLAVAALILNVLMSRWIEQQRTTIGTLKALGYPLLPIVWHYVKFGGFVGILGGAVGCALGFWLASLVTELYTQFYEFPDLRNEFYPLKTAIGMAISLVCALTGTLHGVHAVIRLQPAEAMRSKPPRQGGAILLERVGWFWRRLSFRWRMVLRSVIRSRLRTAAGVFASCMGAAILVTGFTMSQAIHFLIDFQFELVQRSDMDLALKDQASIAALFEAQRLPGVDLAEPELSVSCVYENGPYHKRAGIIGILPDAHLTIPRDADGNRIDVPEVGLAMSRKLAEILHLEEGDLVSVRMIQGLRQTHTVPVVHIVDSYLGIAVYANIYYVNRLVNEEFAVSGLQLALNRDPHSFRVLNRDLKDMPAIQSVSSKHDMIDNINETVIKTQNTFILLLILFAGVIFFGSVLNASLISLSERQREIATLRVLGYGPWEIGSLFLRESMIVNTIGTLFGMVLGYWLSVGLAEAYDSELFRIPVITGPDIWIKTLLVSAMFALMAHGFTQVSIHRMDWLDALQVKE